ncbi:MAG TPA: methyltransferase domain-containing protein [Stellaceae bacterium]|jgi:SAM-dependent methyltransferase
MPDDPPPLSGAPTHRVGNHNVPEDWPVTGEASRSFLEKLRGGFYATYMAGDIVLDIGYRGSVDNPSPVLPHAIGIDIDYPGYDGSRLPFEHGTVDTVYSSHMLEHAADYVATIRDWHRVLRVGGFIVCVVPHQFLYEKRWRLPSRWNGDHKRFYTPASLLREFEVALPPNTYRVRHVRDQDSGYLYDVGPEEHAGGGYEIELVIEKRAAPSWTLAGTPPCEPGRDMNAIWFDAAIRGAVDEILRRRPGLWRSALSRLARFLSPGRTMRACADEARAEGRWERAARFYADALIEQPGSAVLWGRVAEALEHAEYREEAAFARRRASELRRAAP